MGPGRFKIIIQSILGIFIFLLLTLLYILPSAENLICKVKGTQIPRVIENGEQVLEEKALEYQFGKVMWNSVPLKVKCPNGLLKRVGRVGDGGKWTCGVETLEKSGRPTPCLIYSFGVSDDSSWEAEVLKKTNHCTVYAYDPTVSKIGKPLLPSNPRVNFQSLGIGGEDSSFSRIRTLKTLMEENGDHRFLAILKMDVEGAEFSTLNRILEDFPADLPFGQLLVEMHVGYWDEHQLDALLSFFRRLESRGMSLFYKEINPIHPRHCAEFSFLNTRSQQWSTVKLERI